METKLGVAEVVLMKGVTKEQYKVYRDFESNKD